MYHNKGTKQVKVITAQAPTISEYWHELLKYYSMIGVFAQQEIKSAYAQTYFGLLWSVLRPLITVAIFTVIFNFFLKVPTEQPYYIFAFTGMIAWNYFAQLANIGSNIMIEKQDLLKKMYFPKLILPLSTVLVTGVDFLVSLAILFIMMILEGEILSIKIMSLPFFILLNIFCGLFVALWMNVLNIRFRDLNQIVPAIIGIAIWVSPVFYPTTIIPKGYEFFVYINPMAGIIKGYRFALLGETFPVWQYWPAIVIVVIGAFLATFMLIRNEDKMVDYA
ncbi:MAG: ABC transporter permease [Chitinophagales bacterium]